MAHFYGTLQGARGKATRCGSKGSGIETTAAGWGGAVTVRVYEHDGADCFEVTLHPWQGSGGQSKLLARGALCARGEARPIRGSEGEGLVVDGAV